MDISAARKPQQQDIQANAVIYARYSSHGQQEQSIDGQLRDCKSFAEREGMSIVGEYIDRAISGRTDERPDFQRMITDAEKLQFNYIIVWKLDRFARNRYDSAFYKQTLRKHGVKVISATEKISDDPEGIILEGLIESLAEYYSANLSKHIKRGQRESILKGHHVGSIPPIGFKVVNKRLVADEDKVPIIQYAFKEYANGKTKKEILQALTAKGVLNYYGRPLTHSALQHALRNEKYIGIYKFNGQIVPGACDALIDEDTFYKVQKKLDSRSHGKSGEKARQEYLLLGKAFCGICGTRFIGDAGTARSGEMYSYYVCGKRKKLRACNKKNEKKGFLEWYIVEQTLLYVLRPERMEYIASRIVLRYKEEFNDTKIKELERHLAKIEREADAAVDATLKAPEHSRQRFYDKLDMLMLQKKDTESELATLRIASKAKYTTEQIIAWLKKFTQGDPIDINFQKTIIDVFINSIYIYDDKIVIYYNVKDGKQISYIEMCDNTDDDGGDVVRISNKNLHLPNQYPNHRYIFIYGLFGIIIYR